MDTTRSSPAAPRPLGPSPDVLNRVDDAWPEGRDLPDARLRPRTPREVADLGEAVARRHLERRGCTTLAANWRTPDARPRGELDLVVRDPAGTLVVVEVKARRGTRTATPAEAVTARKLDQVRHLALAWLRHHPVPRRGLRFDVVAVVFQPDGRVRLTQLEGVQ